MEPSLPEWDRLRLGRCRLSYDRSIAHLTMTPEEYERFITDPFVDETLVGAEGVALLVVEGEAPAVCTPGSLPVVVCWLGDELGGNGPDAADLVVSRKEVNHVVDLVGRCPLAATALVTLLRASVGVGIDDALVLESATYSMLQSGPEFAAWRGSTWPEPLRDDGPVVVAHRDDDVMTIELDRPQRHNAITAQLRDEIAAMLAVAVTDRSIEQVVLRGKGPSFSSGGDLSEFGARSDSASAHRIRLARSPARLLHHIAPRLTVRVHGSTLGGGLEMAAFAHHVVAHPATQLGLPEVGLGLVPGAGGTVSVSRRAGRQRCAALTLACDTIDTPTAHRWGLVDAVDPSWSG